MITIVLKSKQNDLSFLYFMVIGQSFHITMMSILKNWVLYICYAFYIVPYCFRNHHTESEIKRTILTCPTKQLELSIADLWWSDPSHRKSTLLKIIYLPVSKSSLHMCLLRGHSFLWLYFIDINLSLPNSFLTFSIFLCRVQQQFQ